MTPGGVENGAIELAVLKIPYMDPRSCLQPSRSHFSPGLKLILRTQVTNTEIATFQSLSKGVYDIYIYIYIAKSYISDYDIFINMSKTCTLNFLVYYSEKVFNMEYRTRLTHYSNEFRRQRSVEIQISHYCAFP